MRREAEVIMRVEEILKKKVTEKAIDKVIKRATERVTEKLTKTQILIMIIKTKIRTVIERTLIRENKAIPIQLKPLRQEESSLSQRTGMLIRNSKESLRTDQSLKMLVSREKPNYY